MGLFNFAKKQEPAKRFTPINIFEVIDGDVIPIFTGNNSKAKLLKYFLEIPELNAVISQDAKMFAKMNLTVKSKVTGKEVALTNQIQHLLKYPNWQQTKKEFITQDRLFRLIYGNNYIHFLKPVGMGVKQMTSLNPINLEMKEPEKSLPAFLRVGVAEGTKYVYKHNNTDYSIPYDDVLHLNNNSVKGEGSTGISAIESIIPNLENIKASYESRGMLIRHRGALGILSNGAKEQTGVLLAQDPKEIEKLQNSYRKYGTLKGQYQLLMTNLQLKWQSMAMNPRDLMLFEEIEADFQKICDVFGFKSEMFSTISGSTFENAKQYERAAYQNTIIPAAQEYVDALNNHFGLTEDKSSNIIVGEFEHLEIFNEDKKLRGETIQVTTNALSQAYTDGAITLEAYQNEMLKFGIGL